MQAVPWALFLLVMIDALASRDETPPGLHVQPLGEGLCYAAVATFVMVLGLVLMYRLGAHRRWAWRGAVAYHCACGITYGWRLYEMQSSAGAVLYGLFFLGLCSSGLASLLWPSTVRHCLASSGQGASSGEVEPSRRTQVRRLSPRRPG